VAGPGQRYSVYVSVQSGKLSDYPSKDIVWYLLIVLLRLFPILYKCFVPICSLLIVLLCLFAFC
jgi:hypothetical protein